MTSAESEASSVEVSEVSVQPPYFRTRGATASPVMRFQCPPAYVDIV